MSAGAVVVTDIEERNLSPHFWDVVVDDEIVNDLLGLMSAAIKRSAARGRSVVAFRLEHFRYGPYRLPRHTLPEISAYFEAQGINVVFHDPLECDETCGVIKHFKNAHFGYVLTWE